MLHAGKEKYCGGSDNIHVYYALWCGLVIAWDQVNFDQGFPSGLELTN